MHILFSALATVDYDGLTYYNNEINASLSRYSRLGDKITCIAHLNKTDKSKHDPIADSKVDFVFINKINTPRGFLLGYSSDKKRIEEIVKKVDFCIIHVFSMHASTVIEYAKQYNVPYVTVAVGCPWDAYWNYNLLGKFLAPINYLKMRKIQRESPASIYVTNKFLQHRYPTFGPWVSCSNVDIASGDDTLWAARKRNIEKRNKDIRYKIATLAALNVRYKGQEYVLQALSKLKRRGVDRFEYHLAGGGDCSFLSELVHKLDLQDCVYIHGAIPHIEVPAFLDSMDIYIQPSKQEGLPRALIEAMSRGLLCIGSKTAGIPELLEKEYVFPKGNSNAIAKILSGLDPEDLLIQGERNFNEAKQYDRKIINKRRLNFITGLLPK